MNYLFEHASQNLSDSDMVGITIQNRVNQNDKPIEIRFIRKDKLAGYVIWSVFEKVSHFNSRFNALEKLIVTVYSVGMPVSFGSVIKSRGRQLSIMAQLKRSVVHVTAEYYSLASALIIATEKV